MERNAGLMTSNTCLEFGTDEIGEDEIGESLCVLQIREHLYNVCYKKGVSICFDVGKFLTKNFP